MSLEQRLADDATFRENIFIGTIEQTVRYITNFVEQKEYMTEDSRECAQEFSRKYGKCVWKGSATPEFMKDLKDYMMPALLERNSKKLFPYIILSVFGAGAIILAYQVKSAFTGIMGGITALVSAYLCYSIGKQINKDINAIRTAMDRHPDVVDKALVYLRGKQND